MAASLSSAFLMAAVLQATVPQAPYPQPAPGTSYDPSVPTLTQVVGHDFGEEITSPAEITAYLRALHEAAPDRTRLIRYATSWEGRDLHAILIASPGNMGRIDQIREGIGRLADPRTLVPSEAEGLIAELPVVVALHHGVHGNEISSAGAAMAEAYHILAALEDPTVETILSEAVVLIDPAQNPDGRARFLAHTALTRGAWPSAHPLSAEHDEPWPGGRVNHYLFDLNRDWFAQTQPESRGRTGLLLDWNPQVVVDLHEMGGNSTYYFPPNAVPGNPFTTETQRQALEEVGRNNGDAFDQRGFPYFVGEVFDAFYPGYGVSWPMAQGALGMTFEKASARGLAYRRSDGTLLHYGDGVAEHFTAALTTTHTAALNRERILREYLEFRRTAIEMGRSGARAIVLYSEHDPAMAARLARTLSRNGIEILATSESFTAGGRDFPAGTFVVPMDQPTHRLARNLLDPEVSLPADFLEVQRERRANRLRDQIYDVTAWSLPLLWDVEAIQISEDLSLEGSVIPGRGLEPLVGAEGSAPWSLAHPSPGGMIMTLEMPVLPPARVGYALPWNSATAALAAEALRTGIPLRTAGASFSVEGRTFPVGSLLIRTGALDEEARSSLALMAKRHSAELVPVDTSFPSGDGISLGSNQFAPLQPPRVLLAWGEPSSTYSTGWARYVLERRYGVDVTAVRTDALGRVDLSEFNVLVLPSGNFTSVFGESGLGRLEDWVSRGGTLITVGESSRWAARAGLLSTTTELRGGAPDEPGSTSSRPPAEQPIEFLEAIEPPTERPQPVPGAILRVTLDETHWLAAGTDGEVQVLAESNRIFSPLTLDRGANVGRYASLERLVASGVVWEDTRAQLVNKAYLMHEPRGQGHVIGFSEDPNYRAYSEASELLFINAVLLGPGF
jgi:hypothetical protein